MLKKVTFIKKLKGITGISAMALCALSIAACSGGTGGDNTAGDEATVSAESPDGTDAMETIQGNPLPRYDISAKMKAAGEKVDMSGLVEKYKPMVKLADYNGIAVTKDEVYEMTEEEINDELDILLDSFKEYEDVTDGGSVQEGDDIVITTEASVDGKAVENYSFEDMNYQVGSELVAEEFDKQLIGKKSGEDFEINVKFPEDHMDEELLTEGEESLNGKTVLFKAKISSIQRAAEETMNDEWVKSHQDKLSAYSYDGVNTVDELKSKIKSVTEEYRASSLLKEFGAEALETVIDNSEFISFPEDELKTLKDQTISNIEQEFEAYKDMMEIESLEEYLEASYDINGDSGLDDYATGQAQEYLKHKMVIVLVADAAGIEIGEEDVKSLGDEMALYYGFENYEKMLEQYGDSVRESAVFEALYDKVVSYLGSQADPSLEPEASDDLMIEDIMDTEAETETSAAG